jgi:hypothetical protein
MYSEDDLDAAVAAGVLPADSVRAFREHVARRRELPAADEEYVRLLGGFNDVFVVIACGLVLGAVFGLARALLPWAGPAAVAVLAWALAEFFVRRRRMALPAIVLLLAFVGAVFAAVLGLGQPPAAASAAAAVAAGLHWARFRVPITVAAGAAAVVGLAVGLLLQWPDGLRWLSPLLLLAGLAVFGLAMRWDRSDVARATRRADVAFWLHLLAAPLLVHPVFTGLGLFELQVEPARALAGIALYGLLSVVSLAIDRRALMVSALAYVMVAFGSLIKDYGGVGTATAVTAFVLGSALVLLSAFWHGARGAVLRACPPALRQRLPARG